MSQCLCHRFGFDQTRIQRLLALVGLSDPENHRLARQLHAHVIRPNIDRIVDDFHVLLASHRAFRKIVSDQSRVDFLRATHRKYLLTLGQQYHDPEYFEDRLKIGSAHRKAGVLLSIYLSFYSHLQTLLIENIPAESFVDRESLADLINFIIRISSLDMTLAIEVYHSEEVVDLEESIRSISNEKEHLRSSLQTDSLTGVFSRQHVLQILEERLKDAHQPGQTLSVVMADLDHFKHINDRHGHYVGDRLLQAVAGRMVKALRKTDIVGRYGGEEFLIILSDAGVDLAARLARRIRRQVAAYPVHVDAYTIPITVSLGVAEARPGDDPKTLAVRADDALYLAKDSGRNAVCSERDLHKKKGQLIA